MDAKSAEKSLQAASNQQLSSPKKTASTPTANNISISSFFANTQPKTTHEPAPKNNSLIIDAFEKKFKKVFRLAAITNDNLILELETYFPDDMYDKACKIIDDFKHKNIIDNSYQFTSRNEAVKKFDVKINIPLKFIISSELKSL
jgi:hypothetical protein